MLSFDREVREEWPLVKGRCEMGVGAMKTTGELEGWRWHCGASQIINSYHNAT